MNRAAFVFFAALFLLLGSGRLDSVDPKAQLQAATLLVHKGTLKADFSPMPDLPNIWVPDGSGRFYQAHDLGGVLFMLPSAALGAAFSRASADAQFVDPPWISRFAVSLSYTLFAALGCTALFLFLSRLYTGRTALLLTLMFATTTIFWAYTKSAYDVLGACVGVCLLIAAAGGAYLKPEARLRDGAAIGLAFVLACSFRYSLGPFLLPGVLAFLWLLSRRQGRHAALGALATMAVVMAPAVLYNVMRTGSALQTGATGGWSPLLALQGSVGAGLFGLLLSPNRGLLVFAPVFLMLAAVPFVWRRLPVVVRQLTACLGFAACGYLLLISKMTYWAGVGGWGPRYLVPILPILFLPVAAATIVLWSRWRVALALLIALSATLNVAPVLVNHSLAVGLVRDAMNPDARQPRQQIAVWEGMWRGIRGEPLPAAPAVAADPVRRQAMFFPDLWLAHLARYSAVGALLALLGAALLLSIAGAAWRRLHSGAGDPAEYTSRGACT